jgi:RNA ligase
LWAFFVDKASSLWYDDYMRLDLNAINAEIALGNVNRQVHPTLPLSIYKYSQLCVFSRAWNETTLLCRGIVLDDLGNVVINSFPKFFNHSEGDGLQGYQIRKNAGMAYTVTDKMDGSLIQVARYNGHLVISSSGSFTSPQAMKATELLRGKEEYIEENWTYLFELIYPENRIVLNYGDKVSLTLLAMRHTETGNEAGFGLWPDDIFEAVTPLALTLDEIEIDLKRDAFINKEGYIVKFADGHRVKMKYDRYCELHKTISGLSELSVWENLSNNVDIEKVLSHIPDELFDWVKKTKTDLRGQFDSIERVAVALNVVVRNFNDRKEQAEWLLTHHKKAAPIVFCMLDGKDYSKLIWNMIRPISAESKKFGRGEG